MSRYDKIMRMIDTGFSDEDIAGLYKTGADTIAVYRKAHDGKLTLESTVEGTRVGDNEDRDATIIRMYMTHHKAKTIAESMGVKYGTVRHVIEKYRAENGLKGRLKRGRDGGYDDGL